MTAFISLRSDALRGDVGLCMAGRSNALQSNSKFTGLKYGRKIYRISAKCCWVVHSRAQQCFAMLSAALMGSAQHGAPKTTPPRKGRKISPMPSAAERSYAVLRLDMQCPAVPCYNTRRKNAGRFLSGDMRYLAMCGSVLRRIAGHGLTLLLHPWKHGKIFLSIASHAVSSSDRLCAAFSCNAFQKHSPSKTGEQLL